MKKAVDAVFEKKDFFADGICHLSLAWCLPALGEGRAEARIRAHMESALHTLLSEAEKILPRLRLAFEENTHPQKRFRHRPLCLSLSFLPIEGGRQRAFLRVLSLSQGGRPLSEIREKVAFDRESGRARF